MGEGNAAGLRLRAGDQGESEQRVPAQFASGDEPAGLAVEPDVQALESEGARELGPGERGRAADAAGRRNADHQEVDQPDAGNRRVNSGRGESDLLAGNAEAVVQGAWRDVQARFREARLRGREQLPSREPAEEHPPRDQDRNGPGATGHDSAAPLRRRTASNASRSSAVSTTMDTLAGKAAFPRCVLRMGTMISAASSTERLPAPVPIGGTVRVVNSHSCAWCRVARHARATPSRVTGSVSLWMTAWMTNSAGRSPPPAVTTAAPTARSFCNCRRARNSDPPTCSSRRTTGVVGSRRAVAGRTIASVLRNARSSTTTRITGRLPPES